MEFSLILLAFNQEQYIAEAVHSVLEQTCRPIEILISDDCSTDGTFQIIEEIAGTYRGPHKVILNRNKRNLGVVSHIRESLDRSTGEFIIAASGDDVSLPHRSARIIDLAERTGAWLVHSNAICIDRYGQEVRPHYGDAELMNDHNIVAVASAERLYLGATAGFHRDMYKKYGVLDDPALFEDLIYGFRAALEGRVAFCEEPLVRYRTAVGISAGPTQRPSEERPWTREERLNRLLAVMDQRLKDANTFGLPTYHPVISAIKNKKTDILLEKSILRRDFLKLGRTLIANPEKAYKLLQIKYKQFADRLTQ